MPAFSGASITIRHCYLRVAALRPYSRLETFTPTRCRPAAGDLGVLLLVVEDAEEG